MAAAFLAMNEVFGRFFDVDVVEMFEPRAYAQSGAPRDLFVFDDQLHMVRGSQRAGGAGLRALAQGPSSAPAFKSNPYNPKNLPDERGEVWGVWNPALVGLPIDVGNAQIVQFIKDVFLDSQVTIGLLSNVTASSVTIGAEAAPGAEERAGSAARARSSRPPKPPPRATSSMRSPVPRGCWPMACSTWARAIWPTSRSRPTRTSPIRGRATTSRTPPRSTTIRTA